MGLLGSIKASASGLSAERLRMDTIANNVANMHTTRTPEGGPYRRQMVTFAPRTDGFAFLNLFRRSGRQEVATEGVRVNSIVEDTSPPIRSYQPDHPDADAEGYVLMPNINVVTEMTDMISANRAYEANVTVLNAAKNMAMKALEIARR
ncbi:MAG TPA: flagellar basal body rod protein FlgC [Dehalococcoidia bacterium]